MLFRFYYRRAVTPLAVNVDLFKPQDAAAIAKARQMLGISGPYILFLATRDMRKNIAALLRAFADIRQDFPHTLVIAGKQALRHDKSEELAIKLGLQARVKWLDFVPFEHVPALYSGADLFVWPSVYEGWGMPVLEAMACGVPVIVSDGGALPEVAGQAAEIVPFSTDDLVDRFSDKQFIHLLTERMRAVLSDLAKQQAMREAGMRQAHSFSWDTVATSTWEVYKKFAL
jgi:glycosyltransferase involved in cell wall biosynthesis